MANYWWMPDETSQPITLRISKTTPLTDVETWKAFYLPKRMVLTGVLVKNGNARVEYEGRAYVVAPVYCTIVTDTPKRASLLSEAQEKLVRQYARRSGAYLEEVKSFSGDSWTLRAVCHFTEQVRTYGGGYTSSRTMSDIVFSVKRGGDKARATFEAKRAEAEAIMANGAK